MAEVNDKGEVTVEGEFVGRLEGFRFRQDASNSPDEARTLRQAAVQALRPEFHLRADRFYNSPDTEMDFTEQGGLMWGEQAVGKLIAGPEPMRPQVEAFVDEDAGPEVAEKVRRRLQHFIDRKVAAQFEPLLAMSRDETLTGLARGFAFRLVESLGLIPREQVAEEVKSLDQEARSALRKHGVRFGQFTIFLPLLLKPAPTRLRLVLWSLANGLQEFPESPPPGLVTIPHIADVPKMHYTLAGYHPAGQRAIRIDMLERLADLLRAKDSRAGFEATPDMLSITGMTLEQFAGLMQGLGYRAEPGERPKVKAAPAAAEAAPAEGEAPAEVPAEEAPAAEAPSADAEAARTRRPKSRRRSRSRASTPSPGRRAVRIAVRAGTTGGRARGATAARAQPRATPRPKALPPRPVRRAATGPSVRATAMGASPRARAASPTARAPTATNPNPSNRAPRGATGSTRTIRSPSSPRCATGADPVACAGADPARQMAGAGALLQDARPRHGPRRKRPDPAQRPACRQIGPGRGRGRHADLPARGAHPRDPGCRGGPAPRSCHRSPHAL